MESLRAGDINGVSSDTLLERAAALVPVLRERARDCERNRTVSPATIEMLVDAELFRAFQPARFGGFELELTNLLDLGTEIARGCGSTGWVFGVLSDHQWLLGLFALEAQEEVWGANEDALVSATYAPAATAQRVDGGFRLGGRWPFGSGAAVANWHMFGAKIPAAEGSSPGAGLFLVPRESYEIADNWETVGLAGTGSNDVILDDALVPDHRAMAFADLANGGARAHDAPIYKLPFASGVALGTLSPVLGMTKGAIEAFTESNRTRVSSGGATRGAAKAAESQIVQSRLAEAAGLYDAAQALLHSDLRRAHDVVAEEALPIADRVRLRRDYALSVRLCTEALDALFQSGGSATIHLDNPVQRAWRDVNVAARHVGLSWDVNSLPFGQYELGQDPVGQF